MNLSISNIAWEAEWDSSVYGIMRKYGFHGLEIAPTRIFPSNPYDKICDAGAWSSHLQEMESLRISSIQSIWYGKQESLFGTKEERRNLLRYTKKAIDFAEAIACGNIVFGCPRNRMMPEGADESIAVEFFMELSEYAQMHHTVLSMEANPAIYHTNYINTTMEAISFVQKINHPGFRVNLDLGTMIENNEDIDILAGKIKLVNHVHISEPNLRKIKKREIHYKLAERLKKEDYCGYVSVEMGKQSNLDVIEEICVYVKEVF